MSEECRTQPLRVAIYLTDTTIPDGLLVHVQIFNTINFIDNSQLFPSVANANMRANDYQKIKLIFIGARFLIFVTDTIHLFTLVISLIPKLTLFPYISYVWFLSHNHSIGQQYLVVPFYSNRTYSYACHCLATSGLANTCF